MRKSRRAFSTKRRIGWREALRRESELARDDMIRRLLAKPMHKRVWFLRVRHPGGGSAI